MNITYKTARVCGFTVPSAHPNYYLFPPVIPVKTAILNGFCKMLSLMSGFLSISAMVPSNFDTPAPICLPWYPQLNVLIHLLPWASMAISLTTSLGELVLVEATVKFVILCALAWFMGKSKTIAKGKAKFLVRHYFLCYFKNLTLGSSNFYSFTNLPVKIWLSDNTFTR
jgi:hypothetical protein